MSQFFSDPGQSIVSKREIESVFLCRAYIFSSLHAWSGRGKGKDPSSSLPARILCACVQITRPTSEVSTAIPMATLIVELL